MLVMTNAQAALIAAATWMAKRPHAGEPDVLDLADRWQRRLNAQDATQEATSAPQADERASSSPDAPQSIPGGVVGACSVCGNTLWRRAATGELVDRLGSPVHAYSSTFTTTEEPHRL